MVELNIKPPRINPFKPKNASIWKWLGTIILGTTISLVLTIIAAQLLEKRQRAKDRRLSALMVMSNIESFAQDLDDYYEELGRADTVSAWLLSHSMEELGELPTETLRALSLECVRADLVYYDKTAENIFSNNIETWKNMGNFQFVDKVGVCFRLMNTIEEMLNGKSHEIEARINDIRNNPDQYPGDDFVMKILQDPGVKGHMQYIHNKRVLLQYFSAKLRYRNRQNMAAIGISEKEVMAFTEERLQEIVLDEEEPEVAYYRSARLQADSLETMREFDSLISLN